jgi:hypothetical protein
MHLRCDLCKRRGGNGDWACAGGSVAACGSGGFYVALPIGHLCELWGKVYITVGAEGSGQKNNEGDPELFWAVWTFFNSRL